MSFGQGEPSWGPGGTQTPDWAALADESAARKRRKRWLLIGGGVLATAAIGAIVATAVISANKNDSPTGSGKNASELPAPSDLPSETAEPEPSFSSVAPPPAEPEGLHLRREEGPGADHRRRLLPRQEADDGRPRLRQGRDTADEELRRDHEGRARLRPREQRLRPGDPGHLQQGRRRRHRRPRGLPDGGPGQEGGPAGERQRRHAERLGRRRPSAPPVRSAAAPPTPTAVTPTSPSAGSPTARASPRPTRTSTPPATT